MHLTRNNKSRVFLSCGQQKDTEEVDIARAISQELIKLDFEPYVAVEEQTLKGVADNIFRHLSHSEYVIFIDFKRDLITGGPFDQQYRGGLFSHQELAIASYLKSEILAFQEEGVIKLDGILGFIQANSISFSNRRTLVLLVIGEVRKRIRQGSWNPHWRNELTLERNEKEHKDAIFRPTNSLSRWFHIQVVNRNRLRMATNCTAYILSIRKSGTKRSSKPSLVELKWEGVKTESTIIPPKKYRNLDAVQVFHDSPSVARISINQFLVDYSGFHKEYDLRGPGKFILEYCVFSNDFSPAVGIVELVLRNNLQDVKFHKTERIRQLVISTTKQYKK